MVAWLVCNVKNVRMNRKKKIYHTEVNEHIFNAYIVSFPTFERFFFRDTKICKPFDCHLQCLQKINFRLHKSRHCNRLIIIICCVSQGVSWVDDRCCMSQAQYICRVRTHLLKKCFVIYCTAHILPMDVIVSIEDGNSCT